MWKFSKGHSQDVFPKGRVLVVQRTEPAQVVGQVMGGDAVKAMDPLFETRVVGVDVLNMDCALDAYACAQVDGVVGDAAVLCKVAVGRIAIADQQNICRKNRLQYTTQHNTTQLCFGDLSAPRYPV
jgi:uncharacterized protein with ACT and thioredoxin-like domain